MGEIYPVASPFTNIIFSEFIDILPRSGDAIPPARSAPPPAFAAAVRMLGEAPEPGLGLPACPDNSRPLPDCPETKLTMLKIFLMTAFSIALAQSVPGPNMLAVARAALGQGVRAAFFTTLGIATAILLWVAMMTFGVTTIVVTHHGLFTAMEIVGGAYLCFLAFNAFRTASRRGTLDYQPAADTLSDAQAWRRGLLVCLSNPKAALMWGAVATFMFGAGMSTDEVLCLAPLGFTSALLVYGAYSILFSTARARSAFRRFVRPIEFLFGAAFGALGGVLLASGIRGIAR